MGRKPMSPELKEARGNPGKRPVKKRETAKSVAKRIVLARPAWLTDAMAKQVWARLQASLHFLRDSDVQVFGRYCIYMSDWVTANREIKKSGGAVYETSSAHVEKFKRINPWFVVRSRIEDDLMKLEEKLGLTPLDRQKIIAHLANAAQLPAGDLFDGRNNEGDEGDEASPAPIPSEEVDTIGGLGHGRLN